LKVWAFMATSFTVRYELYACGKKFPHLIVTEPIFLIQCSLCPTHYR
jgi:hypothetical protein